jgi:hypothetical protein
VPVERFEVGRILECGSLKETVYAHRVRLKNRGNSVEDSENRCERLAVGNMFGVAVPGFSISTLHVSTDSSRVCANPLVPW